MRKKVKVDYLVILSSRSLKYLTDILSTLAAVYRSRRPSVMSCGITVYVWPITPSLKGESEISVDTITMMAANRARNTGD